MYNFGGGGDPITWHAKRCCQLHSLGSAENLATVKPAQPFWKAELIVVRQASSSYLLLSGVIPSGRNSVVECVFPKPPALNAVLP